MFDTERFLDEKFRSPRELVAFLKAYGMPAPQEAAVYKWFKRAAVPSEWMPILLGCLEIDNGAPVSLVDYLRSA